MNRATNAGTQKRGDVMRQKVWMSWSTGKDSAFALHELRVRSDIEVTGLLTTVTDTYNRVSMHGVREELLDLQAQALKLPLHKVRIPAKCVNETYESLMSEAISVAQSQGVSCIGFGDLFLEDIRQYRVSKLYGTGIEPLFPLWKRTTQDLARSMLDSGLKAILTCVDPRKLPESFAGREFDDNLLADLPIEVDPCGENGEFHTFVYDGPMFLQPLRVSVGERAVREGFVFADVRPV